MKETSYGVVPFQQFDGEWRVFLVQHRQGHWSLPKGHLEGGESGLETATRELKEETGLDVDQFLSYQSIDEHYQFKRGPVLVEKMVGYYPAKVIGEVVIQVAELKTGSWFSVEEALEKLTFPEARRILQESVGFLPQ